MTELGGNEVTHVDQFFCFSITYRTPHLNVPRFSKYQLFLYETITEQRKEGKTFDQIAEWLNKKGYLTVRRKKLKREYPEEWSDFSLEVVDKTLVNLYPLP